MKLKINLAVLGPLEHNYFHLQLGRNGMEANSQTINIIVLQMEY